MLIDELKKAQMEALKTKDTLKRSVLQIVTGKVKLAEIEKRTKNEPITDDDVLLVINKVIKELDRVARISDGIMRHMIIREDE